MRKVAWISVCVFVAAAGLAGAATRQSKKVDFPDNVLWAGKTLHGGEYTVRWQGDPGNLDVKILDGHQLLAEGRGHLATSKTRYPNDAVVTRRDGSGTPVLTEIELGGKTTALVLGQS